VGPGPHRMAGRALAAGERVSVSQAGPKPDRVPPVPTSTLTTRLDGFAAEIATGSDVVGRAARAAGWLDVFDGTRGVAIGLRYFFEEYPKELAFDAATGELTAYVWSPKAGPMSFARASDRPASEGAVENWARGIAKTSELLVFFHGRDTSADEVARIMRFVLEPPVAHVDPAWYGRSGVYGAFAPRTDAFPEYQRALDYKFDWMLFNQKWQPWYGVFDHGDMMNTFDGRAWNTFGHNEPAQDFMLWLQFMRTGDARLFDAALAMSRHTMDVDNTHWPAGPAYHGESNYPLDYWKTLQQPPGSKYLGVGRRHSAQHWLHILSAHVWVQGWLASYYLAGEHRGLDVARLSADMHLRRLWGEHELTGRRLYLSVWNLVDVWDATKDPALRGRDEGSRRADAPAAAPAGRQPGDRPLRLRQRLRVARARPLSRHDRRRGRGAPPSSATRAPCATCPRSITGWSRTCRRSTAWHSATGSPASRRSSTR
jgi:hypothetical protein